MALGRAQAFLHLGPPCPPPPAREAQESLAKQPKSRPYSGAPLRLCLSDAAALLGEPRVIEDVWLGFGARAVRPWLEVEVEEERLRRAAGEVLRLSLARAKLLEEVLLRTVDVREAQAPSLSVAA